MKRSHAANLALALVLLGWPLNLLGGLFSFADLNDHLTAGERRLYDQVEAGSFFLGMLALLSALVLAGYAYSGARVRAILVILLVAAPVIAGLVSGLYYSTFH